MQRTSKSIFILAGLIAFVGYGCKVYYDLLTSARKMLHEIPLTLEKLQYIIDYYHNTCNQETKQTYNPLQEKVCEIVRNKLKGIHGALYDSEPDTEKDMIVDLQDKMQYFAGQRNQICNLPIVFIAGLFSEMPCNDLNE
jgi:hypothetical protein